MQKTEKIYNTKIIRSGERIEIYKFNNYVIRDGNTLKKEVDNVAEENEIE